MSTFFTRLRRCRQASAAMEFSIVLPIMLAMYAGVLELNNYNNIYLRVTATAFTIEDLVGRQTALSDSGTSGTTGMATLCSLAAPIFGAGSSASLTNLTIQIFDATVSATGTTTVVWESKRTSTSTPISCTKQTSFDPLTLPTSITSSTLDPGTTSVSHLAVVVTYPYTLLLPSSLLNSLHAVGSTSIITGSLAALSGKTITATAYGVPRNNSGAVIPYN